MIDSYSDLANCRRTRHRNFVDGREKRRLRSLPVERMVRQRRHSFEYPFQQQIRLATRHCLVCRVPSTSQVNDLDLFGLPRIHASRPWFFERLLRHVSLFVTCVFKPVGIAGSSFNLAPVLFCVPVDSDHQPGRQCLWPEPCWQVVFGFHAH